MWRRGALLGTPRPRAHSCPRAHPPPPPTHTHAHPPSYHCCSPGRKWGWCSPGPSTPGHTCRCWAGCSCRRWGTCGTARTCPQRVLGERRPPWGPPRSRRSAAEGSRAHRARKRCSRWPLTGGTRAGSSRGPPSQVRRHTGRSRGRGAWGRGLGLGGKSELKTAVSRGAHHNLAQVRPLCTKTTHATPVAH
jgi:hypothetical protein